MGVLFRNVCTLLFLNSFIQDFIANFGISFNQQNFQFGSGLQLMELLIGSGFQFMELPIGSGLLFKLLLIQLLWIYSTGTAAALHRALVILIALYSLFFRLLCELRGLFTENSRVHLQNILIVQIFMLGWLSNANSYQVDFYIQWHFTQAHFKGPSDFMP